LLNRATRASICSEVSDFVLMAVHPIRASCEFDASKPMTRVTELDLVF